MTAPVEFPPRLSRFSLQHPERSRNLMASRNNPEVKPPTTSPYNAAAVFRASVQLPNFDKVEPETWFMVADANFTLRRVTDSTTKYYYVLSKLDMTTLRHLSTFLKQLRGDDLYDEIKAELCDAYEAPLDRKLDALLALTELRDDWLQRWVQSL